MFCNNCGYFLDDKATVCPKCGESVSGAKSKPGKEKKPVKTAEEGKAKRKIKKPVIIGAVAIVLVVAIVVGIVLSSAVNPMTVYKAGKKTLYESDKFNITIVDSVNNETIYINADLGESTEDSLVEIKIKEGDAEPQLFFLSEDGMVTDSRSGKKIPTSEFIGAYNQTIEAMGLEIDLSSIIDEVINNKIDEGAVEKVYDKEASALLSIMFSTKFGQKIDFPDYYTTTQIIERFLKKGISDGTVSFDKIKSAHKGKTYAVTVESKALIDDFVAFAKQDKDLLPILQSYVDNDPNKEFKSIDELAAALIIDIGDLNPEETVTVEITMKSGKITHIKDKHLDITVETE